MLVPELLYLDTARLGRMCATARRAVRDFAGLTSEVGLPLYGAEFLRMGFSALPATLQKRFPGLSNWPGITGLKLSLRRLLGDDVNRPVLLAQRSTLLMRSAAREFFRRCRKILVTDLDWPGYRKLLERERMTERMTEVQLRERIQRQNTSVDEVVQSLATEYRQQECDGLYLTAVSHDGIRLPIDDLVRRIGQASRIEMVVVDGAQDFCHGLPGHDSGSYDMYIAGCHKWLRAALPVGVGIMGRRSNSDSIFANVSHELSDSDLEDPLLRFTNQIECHQLDRHTETVNVWPLIACGGAVQEALSRRSHRVEHHSQQSRNLDLAVEIAHRTGWTPLLPATQLRTGILILEHPQLVDGTCSAGEMSRLFQNVGISLTAYELGQIRLSLPKWPWATVDLDRLKRALSQAN